MLLVLLCRGTGYVSLDQLIRHFVPCMIRRFRP